MTESSDLLLFVESIGCHFHPSKRCQYCNHMYSVNAAFAPYFDHIRIHVLQFSLGSVQGVGRRVQFVGFEALIGEPDFERLVIFLSQSHCEPCNSSVGGLKLLTAGTASFSAWEEAASVVTNRLARGTTTSDLATRRARGARNAREIMVVVCRRGCRLLEKLSRRKIPAD